MKKLFMVITVICLMIFTGCGNNDSVLTITDIVYGELKSENKYTIYLKENDSFVPYLVLKNDYNGNTLLLRKYILNEPQIYNSYDSYYAKSYIDAYLCETFYPQLDAELQKYIADSEITIITELEIQIGNNDTESIYRKVFLLSFNELCFTKHRTVEGEPLKYFSDNYYRRIAYTEGGQPSSWGLRTAALGYTCMAMGIGPDGAGGAGGTYYKNGVRPAFCLKPETKVCKSSDVVEGKEVYVIAEE